MTRPLLKSFRAGRIVVTLTSLAGAGCAHADPSGFVGDIGAGASYVQPHMAGMKSKADPIPFVNGDWGPAFARLDAFGVKVAPLGYGSLEVVGQFRDEGFTPPGMERRRSSVPIGLGTLQITPIGAFELRSLHDFGKSSGNLLQFRYLAEVPLGPIKLYPEVGLEYQDQKYARYYYGTKAGEVAGSTVPFSPSSAFNPFLGVFGEAHLVGSWYVDAYLHRSFLDDSVSGSPLVTRKAFNSGLLAPLLPVLARDPAV